jgi:hypothetical protein
MRATRSFLLLEVVVGLALLAGLGVWLLKLQTASVRQYRAAQQRAEIAALVEQLLWTWSTSGTPVTLPATGQLDERLRWRREVQPVRIAPGVVPTQVSVLVTRDEPDGGTHEVYRVDWLVPRGLSRRNER